jgi:ppGpp synthetase/RelA/SpoT-type nucleotidyltranferase
MKGVNENGKPKDEIEFKAWLKSELGFDVNGRYEFYYKTVVQTLKTEFEKSDFWKEVLTNLPETNDQYRIDKGVYLLIPSNVPEVHVKSLNSLMIKAFRKNILNNKNFPEAPNGGWITPENWFERVNDIIRTTIVVKYLDGVEIIINQLSQLSDNRNFGFSSSLEAREEGYYAAHSGILIPLSIPDQNFSPIDITINVEVQVTTQIQEIIKTLLHKHYENNRKILAPIDYKWQWDYKSPEFTPNYLGHIIQYVEGMIVEVRDKGK